MSLQIFIICVLIFCFIPTVIEILCAEYPISSQTGTVSNSNTNGWPRLQYYNYNNDTWTYQFTTPWPTLGNRQFPNYQKTTSRSTLDQTRQNVNYPIWVQPTQTVPQFPTSGSSTFLSSPREAPLSNHSEVLDDELRRFSDNLFEQDVNNAASFVTINYQGKTTSGSKVDQAPLPLLNVHRHAFNIPTIAKLMVLHDNYLLETNAVENVNFQEQQEENNFLDAAIATPVMQLTRNFLVEKGRIGNDPNEFKNILKEIWFTTYPRKRGQLGSSGFEHVFLAEIKNNQISGLHNWIYFNQEEQKNNINYLGYLKIFDLGNKGAILKTHFTFRGLDKPVDGIFIGTSPEFEMALYSTCFLLRSDRICPLRLAGKKFIIRTFTFTYQGKKLIGSAFPEI